MPKKIDKKTREQLKLKKQLHKQKREKLRREKTQKKIQEELEKAKLEALRDILEPTKEELEIAAKDVQIHKTIVKLMFPKDDVDTNLNINNIFMTKQTARPILSKVVNSTTVHTLNLSNMFLRDEVGILIANCLKRNKSIQVLNLNNNLFSNITAGHIGDALMENKHLKYLNLESIPNLSKVSRKKKEKNTKSASSEFKNGNIGIDTLAKSLSKNRTLETLNLTYCNLTSKDGKSFATYLKTNESLTSLDISLGNPDISFIDLEAIGNVINKNYSVVLKKELIKKQEYESNEPERHKRYLEIIKEQKLNDMKRHVDRKIEMMILAEEEKLRKEIQDRRSLELAQLRDAGERERFRLRRVANAKDNGDNDNRNKKQQGKKRGVKTKEKKRK